MTQEDVLDIFRSAGALLEGHFVLSSGLHAKQYFQAARVFQHPDLAEKLCVALAQKVTAQLGDKPDYVVAPALGAVLVGYELARALCAQSLFVERDSNNQFALRRGFALPADAKVLMVEDIITTGKSVREAMGVVANTGANIIGLACVIDRSGGKAQFDAPLTALAQLEVETYAENALPAELQEIPVEAPGSRYLKEAVG